MQRKNVYKKVFDTLCVSVLWQQILPHGIDGKMMGKDFLQ